MNRWHNLPQFVLSLHYGVGGKLKSPVFIAHEVSGLVLV
jgi:hypothetical protein